MYINTENEIQSFIDARQWYYANNKVSNLISMKDNKIQNYDDANGITSYIIKFVNFYNKKYNCWAIRLNNISRVVSVKNNNPIYAKSYTQAGISDILIIIKGLAFFVEVKWGKDKMSENQEIFQSNVNSAGATYIIIKNILDFLQFFENTLKIIYK